MAAKGADLLELGIPFSDPLADGPTIQAASNRAVHGGIHLKEVLQLAGEIRQKTAIPFPYGLLSLSLFSNMNCVRAWPV